MDDFDNETPTQPTFELTKEEHELLKQIVNQRSKSRNLREQVLNALRVVEKRETPTRNFRVNAGGLIK